MHGICGTQGCASPSCTPGITQLHRRGPSHQPVLNTNTSQRPPPHPGLAAGGSRRARGRRRALPAIPGGVGHIRGAALSRDEQEVRAALGTDPNLPCMFAGKDAESTLAAGLPRPPLVPPHRDPSPTACLLPPRSFRCAPVAFSCTTFLRIPPFCTSSKPLTLPPLPMAPPLFLRPCSCPAGSCAVPTQCLCAGTRPAEPAGTACAPG